MVIKTIATSENRSSRDFCSIGVDRVSKPRQGIPEIENNFFDGSVRRNQPGAQIADVDLAFD
jgi:uncharacterized protein YegP (UPF0339 family)